MSKEKAIVMQLEASAMIVVTASGVFRRLPLPPQRPRPGQTIEIEVEDKKPKATRRSFYLAVAAAVALLLFASLLKPFSITPAVASVQLDMVPQLTLFVSKDNKVSALQAGNREGKQLIASLNLRGMDVYEAVRLITTSAIEAGYISSQKTNFIFATLKAQGPSAEVNVDKDEVQEVIHQQMTSRQLTGYVVANNASASTADQAAMLGLPVTSYLIMEQAQKTGFELPAQKFKEEPLRKVLGDATPETIDKMFPGAACGIEQAGGLGLHPTGSMGMDGDGMMNRGPDPGRLPGRQELTPVPQPEVENPWSGQWPMGRPGMDGNRGMMFPGMSGGGGMMLPGRGGGMTAR